MGITVVEVTKHFGDFVALDDVSVVLLLISLGVLLLIGAFRHWRTRHDR